MPTLGTTVGSDDYTDLTTTLSLSVGSNYIAQNISNVPIYLTEQSSAPDNDTSFIVMNPYVPFGLESRSRLNFYAKAARDSASITITPSA